MDPYTYLSKILGASRETLENLDKAMTTRLGKSGILAGVAEENQAHIQNALAQLNLAPSATTVDVRAALKAMILRNEGQLLARLADVEGKTQFEKAANLSRRIARVGNGFFLKKSFAENILRQRKPENLLKHLGYASVDDLLAHEDVTEAFAALRFMESQQWMHETFEAAYSSFTAADFEERPIDIKVLGPQWQEVAQKFVAKKHHNVSHLKEFGVIFLNPISEDTPGKFLRDFALLFHYFHEVEFYAKLFRRHAAGADFASHLKSLLRGDVKDATTVGEGEWLIIQRYLWKENVSDPRLFIPHVNPESMHWRRGERDLVLYGEERADLDTEFWSIAADWVANYFDHGDETLVSFDMEDNAMALVSEREGRPQEFFTYHQSEALWTHLFEAYAGGEEQMEKLLIEHFQDGSIRF